MADFTHYQAEDAVEGNSSSDHNRNANDEVILLLTIQILKKMFLIIMVLPV